MADTERTEAATPKRRQKFAEKGMVAKSAEANTLGLLLGALVVFRSQGYQFVEGLSSLVRRYLVLIRSPRPMSTEEVATLVGTVARELLLLMLPIFVAVALGGLVAHLAQSGGKMSFNFKLMKFDIEKLNPLPRIQDLFRRVFGSKQLLVELAKTFFKLAMIGGAVTLVLMDEFPAFLRLSQISILEILDQIAAASDRVLFTVLIFSVVLAAADFYWQKRSLDQRMKMTKYEVKEERKQAEGDPLVKSKQRGKQREAAMARMMSNVSNADVVVTNPTHYAVALSYRAMEMPVPQVVAKGKGHVALRIRAEARRHGIPIVENKPLARLLHKTVQVGAFIPEELYQAVAQVLAYVYKMRGINPGSGA